MGTLVMLPLISTVRLALMGWPPPPPGPVDVMLEVALHWDCWAVMRNGRRRQRRRRHGMKERMLRERQVGNDKHKEPDKGQNKTERER